MTIEEVVLYVKNYFDTISESIAKLSNKNEKHLRRIPLWCIHQDILILYFPKVERLKIYVNPYTEKMDTTLIIINNRQEFSEKIDFVNNWLKQGNAGGFIPTLTDTMYPARNETSVAVVGVRIGSSENEFGGLPSINQHYAHLLSQHEIVDKFSTDSAKMNALNNWNSAVIGKTVSTTDRYDTNIVATIEVLEKMIRKKRFLERNIHRYINEYSHIVLPPHKKCYFEKKIYDSNDNYEVADFILERDIGMPALLIELENPTMKVFRVNNELTAEANHAKNQIANWARFIDTNSENQKGEFEFLAGKKSRLVIGGRGLENIEQMRNSNHEDTTIWTYELLIREAKMRWNKELEHQYNVIGLQRSLPFKYLVEQRD